MMPDCPPLTLSAMLVSPWRLPSIFMAVVMLGLVIFLIWFILDSRRWRREQQARHAVREQLWAERDPETYARIMLQRAEEEALVAATLAQYQPWWRRLRRRNQP